MTRTADDGVATPKVRKDVLRNRALLLEAADRLMASRGLDMTLHELADAAGVGVGTVYRHFADRDALLDALVVRRLETAYDIVRAAEDVEDPIQALRQAFVELCAYQFADRGVSQAITVHSGRLHSFARERIAPMFIRLADRARSTGRLRADFDAGDFPMVFQAVGALHIAAPVRPDLWRRYLEALLDGFMTQERDRVGADVPAAPSMAEVDQIGPSLGR